MSQEVDVFFRKVTLDKDVSALELALQRVDDLLDFGRYPYQTDTDLLAAVGHAIKAARRVVAGYRS